MHRSPLAVLLLLALPAGALAAPGGHRVGRRPARAHRLPSATAAHPRLAVSFGGVGGNPLLAVVRQRFVVSGVLSPYASGQRINVRVLREGRVVVNRTLTPRANGKGVGLFSFTYASNRSGHVKVSASHPATAQEGAASAAGPALIIVRGSLSAGERGAGVRVLQRELGSLGFAVPQSGTLDSSTARAVTAFRKLTGLPRTSRVDSSVFSRIAHGGGHFHVRFPRHGRHVEADLSHQVLAEIDGRRVLRIYTMSSGKPSTPTVIGHFRVYSKTPGTNGEGMVDSNYFIRGYAIHGYADVPTYAASHGCLRIPIPDASAVYSWIKVGYPVDVYQNHGGSTTIRGNAGP